MEKHENLDTQPATWLALFADNREGKKPMMKPEDLDRTGWVQMMPLRAPVVEITPMRFGGRDSDGLSG